MNVVIPKVSFSVFKYNCARCNSCFIGETYHHFQARIDERTKTDKNWIIYKHLPENEDFFNSFMCEVDCFLTLGSANRISVKNKRKYVY